MFDTTKGFFHVPMDAKFKLLTVMSTPYGIYIYNVLAMGLADATDIFELCIHQLLQDYKVLSTLQMTYLYLVEQERNLTLM